MAAAGLTDVIDMLRKEVVICFYDLGIAKLADGPKAYFVLASGEH
jgi:hypothetical protein